MHFMSFEMAAPPKVIIMKSINYGMARRPKGLTKQLYVMHAHDFDDFTTVLGMEFLLDAVQLHLHGLR